MSAVSQHTRPIPPERRPIPCCAPHPRSRPQDKVYWAAEGQGAWLREPGGQPRQLQAAEFRLGEPGLAVVASASHLTPETQQFVAQLKDPVFKQLGSSLKLLMVREGLGGGREPGRRGAEGVRMGPWPRSCVRAARRHLGSRIDESVAGGACGGPTPSGVWTGVVLVRWRGSSLS